MKTPGQIAFEAAGRECPTDWPFVEWDHLPPYGKSYWEAASSAIIEMCEKKCEEELKSWRDYLETANKKRSLVRENAIMSCIASIRALKDTQNGK